MSAGLQNPPTTLLQDHKQSDQPGDDFRYSEAFYGPLAEGDPFVYEDDDEDDDDLDDEDDWDDDEDDFDDDEDDSDDFDEDDFDDFDDDEDY